MTSLETVCIQVARVLAGGTPGLPSPEVSAALARIDAWRKTATQGKWVPTPGEFGDRLSALVENPGVLDQTNQYSWCMPATFFYVMLKDFPGTAIDFALTLYGTGAASLGGLSVQPDVALMSFDFDAYRTGAYPTANPNATLTGNRVDFMLIGAIVDSANTFIDFHGPIDDYGATPGASMSFIESLFARTGFAQTVEGTRLSREADVDRLVERSQSQRIVLVGPVSSFGDGGLVDHAAPLTAPITQDAGTYALRFWSSHLPDNAPLSERDITYNRKDQLRTRFDGFVSVEYR